MSFIKLMNPEGSEVSCPACGASQVNPGNHGRRAFFSRVLGRAPDTVCPQCGERFFPFTAMRTPQELHDMRMRLLIAVVILIALALLEYACPSVWGQNP